MSEPELNVFLSYRRKDSSGYAGWLDLALKHAYPAAEVFRDVEGIDGGTRFRDEIEREIKRCKVFLCMIGPIWTTIKKQGSDTPRLLDPKDLVRREVETAIRLKRRVFPVLVQGAPMPDEDDLPDELHELTEMNAVRMDDQSWNSDLQELVKLLESVRDGGDGQMTGQGIYNRVHKGGGSVFWVGRKGGLAGSALKSDLATGEWRTQLYKVQFGGAQPSSNWFKATQFVALVEESGPYGSNDG